MESLKDRYRISKKGSVHKLEISEGKEDDIGKYTCAVDDDKEQSADIQVFSKFIFQIKILYCFLISSKHVYLL